MAATLVCPAVGGAEGSFDAGDPQDWDLIVTLGSRWHAYDPGPISSWFPDEVEFLRAADRAGVPVLGVCFGAQALAVALGGTVAPCGRSQIGWHVISASSPALAGEWFEWHSDCLRPPSEAEVLATDEVGVQAFRLRRNVGVQFHPEVGLEHLRWWLDHGGEAALCEAGVDVADLLAETRRGEAAAAQRCDILVDWFLDTVVAPFAADQRLDRW